ncbi:hypothetical protein ACNKHO_08810 [Shigella flexneri]
MKKRTMKITQHVWRVSTITSNVKASLFGKLDDLPKDYQEPNPYLDETVHIALNIAKLEKEPRQPAPQNNPQQAQEIVPVFFRSSTFRRQIFQLCKVVSFW